MAKSPQKSAEFNAYIAWLLPVEGEYADDENDRGGRTEWGISQRFKDQIGWHGPVSREQAIEIYYKYFWLGRRCDDMHPFVAWCACDAYVQHPARSAALMIQEALGVETDGHIGPLTIEAAKSPNILLFWQRYRLARVRFYNDIVASDETQDDFIDGWHNRLHKLIEGLYFSGAFEASEKQRGKIAQAVTSPAAKATGAGVSLGALVVAAQSIGLDAVSLAEWAKTTLPGGGFIAVVVAWLAKHNFRS